ncbi:MAG: carboxypeptidase-like regulatory domain-containing protein [Altibacter sp.]|uniref:carboxypeptidase regulatory-like domain-containing protein n=1 Tax=Altibacter sp. TaxID=2024823 RepID=UPI001D29E9D8|nr:carboxypeptidase regulatory-like domain-containing protein [Altibacter sp.]MBZ0327038.1 carboxypeptidase-like regulatory domain-containing protein [Altibacter sp.]
MTKLIWAVLLLFTVSVSAQSVKVRGFIKDSIGQPLEFANVIATVQSSGEIESYGITNSEGRYQLDLPFNATYLLKASFLGYDTKEQTVAVAENSENIQLDFILNELANQLDGVELVYEMPVTVKGDTIVYNADSFTTGDERKLGDVMKKLPGVEVNDEGEIEVEGKAVSKVMVEGKDFFDGDSKLATKNIPADAVDKVEVLRNYNEVDQMRGLGNDQDNIAINIKLKEGKKNFWFGEVTAGAGIADDEGKYLVHPKLFYYSPKYSINLITDFNNIGEVPFTFRDYFNFTGGFRNFNRGGGTNFNISESDLGFAVAQNNRANEIDTKFLAGNFSWAATSKLDLSGFAILSDNTTNMVTNSIRQYIVSGATENTNTINDQRSKLGMLKLSSTYKPNSSFQLDYDALLKTSDQSEDDSTISIVEDKSNNISETIENKPYSINQNANIYFTLNDNNIFAAQVQHLYQDEDPFYRAIQDSIPFRGIFTQFDPQNPGSEIFDPLTEASRYNINQDKNVRTGKLDAKVDYYYVINNKSNINLTLGSTLSSQKFKSGIFQILDNGSENIFSETDFNNDVEFNFTDVFFGLHYKAKVGKFIFTPGLSLHNYNVKNDQLGLSSSQNDWMLLPDLNVILELKKSENLRFNYAISSEYTDVNDYAQSYVFNNYNNLFRGNRFLENALSHTYNLTYFSFNMFNYTNISGSLNYSRRLNGFKRNTAIQGISQVSSLFNSDSNFPDETFSAFARFSKTIKKLQFGLNANVSLNKSNNIVNDEIRESQSLTQAYRGSVRSNFRKWPNFEVGYRLSLNDYDNGGLQQTFFTHRPYANLDMRFLKDFNLTAEWDYYVYNDEAKTVENKYSFVNANLYYQKGDSPWEFQIQASNILDTGFIDTDSFNEQYNTTSQYLVLPRIVMFIVKYDL